MTSGDRFYPFGRQQKRSGATGNHIMGDAAMMFAKTAPLLDVEKAWNAVLKRTIGRFVRGNIAAQNNRILLPEEQKKSHESARRTAESWRGRKAV